MRIAFVSCFFTRAFADQPVWDDIRAQHIDHLVLLGDSLYLDVKGPKLPLLMSDLEFAEHLHRLYTELIAQPQFAALVGALPAKRVHAIWDDHDFLWNDACGAEVHPEHSEKVRISTALLECFRSALARRFEPGSFPASHLDPRLWDSAQPQLATPSLTLAPDVMLHLSDGRTHRTRTHLLAESKRTMFGQAQRDRFTAALAAAPANAVHLWASGSTMAGYQRYERDSRWLLAMAAERRMLMLSGDIHRNNLDAFFERGLPLHEATSSGAAVRDAVVLGGKRRNHGLVDIDAGHVTLRMFKRGALEMQRRLRRSDWLPG
jgi:alkaline phosphatase D